MLIRLGHRSGESERKCGTQGLACSPVVKTPASTAGIMGSIPNQGTKILQTVLVSPEKEKARNSGQCLVHGRKIQHLCFSFVFLNILN